MRVTVDEMTSPVDANHALTVGAIAMLMQMAEDRFGTIFDGQTSCELDVGPHDVFGTSITMEVDGVPRYRLRVEAIRD